jgi:anti-sigma regulatory factor (Ser/Thr protein kinase)
MTRRGPARSTEAAGFPVQRGVVLPAEPASARAARAFVLAACQEAGTDPATCDSAVLLTSETVTNAIVHGRSEARLHVAAAASSIHIEVGDDNSRHPHRVAPDAGALDGRGLQILNALALRWGVRDQPYGKLVWFDLQAD